MSFNQDRVKFCLILSLLISIQPNPSFAQKNLCQNELSRSKRFSNDFYDTIVGPGNVFRGQFTNQLTPQFIQAVGTIVGGKKILSKKWPKK